MAPAKKNNQKKQAGSAKKPTGMTSAAQHRCQNVIAIK